MYIIYVLQSQWEIDIGVYYIMAVIVMRIIYSCILHVCRSSLEWDTRVYYICVGILNETLVNIMCV